MVQPSPRVRKHHIDYRDYHEVAPIFLYHYFDAAVGPFVSLSGLPPAAAERVLDTIRTTKPGTMSAARQPWYLERRRQIEEILRTEFLKKGGVIHRPVPYYLVVGHSPWLATWFEHSAHIRIPIEKFDVATISFTYGDAFPVFSDSPNQLDDKEYRRKLYTYDEIVELIAKYGLPQDWNNDGSQGPQRYIEAQVWSDETLASYQQ